MLNLVSILRMLENHSAVKRVIFAKLFGSIKVAMIYSACRL